MLMFLTCPRLNVVQTFVYKVVAGSKKAKKKISSILRGEKRRARQRHGNVTIRFLVAGNKMSR